MRGYTGGAIPMEYGIIYGKASKQNINTKRSTWSQLVVMGEYFPYNIWFMMLMGAQGYGIENNIIYQDNKSAICIDKNRHNWIYISDISPWKIRYTKARWRWNIVEHI